MNLDSITAYSDRLSQFIELNFSNLSPDKKINPDDKQSKIGVFFSLKNKEDGENLLHNEEMTLLLDEKKEFTSKPFDVINGVWSKILSVN